MLRQAAILNVGAVLPVQTVRGFEVQQEDPGFEKTRRMMSRGALLAAMAMRRALTPCPAGLDPIQTAAFLAVGASAGSMPDLLRILAASTEDGQLSLDRFAHKGVAACNPLLAFQLMNNFTLCHGAIREGLQGPNGAFYGGATAALAAAIQALEEAPFALVGAADSALHPVALHTRAPDAPPPGEAAVILLLARPEVENALGWVEVEQIDDGQNIESIHETGDCLFAMPAIAWARAIAQLAVAPEVRVGGAVFTARRDAPCRSERRSDRRSAPRVVRPPARAVITGVGVVSAFGVGRDALWDGLARGETAIRSLPHLPHFPVGGVVPVTPAIRHGLPLGWLRDRRLGWAVGAAHEAWQHAGRPGGLELSIGLGLEQAYLEDFLPLGPALDWTRDPGTPPVRYRAPLDLPARAIAEILPIQRSVIHASACAAGTLALAWAAARVVEGEAERVLCGGADSMLNPLGLAGLGKLGVISPKQVCRPFDLRRDGILVGEGAACFVVEDEDAARRRGATILARIVGWGSTQDGYAPTAPRPDGSAARRAMEAALRRAKLEPAQISYLNAHGTGTPSNDEAEARAILSIWPTGLPVGSFKGAFGHAMAAAGALELAGCLMAFERGVLPGTVGFAQPDPFVPLPVVAQTTTFSGRYILKNSFGFGGQNASLILEAP